jgi:PAS domain S-box-containing protein
MNVSTKLRAAAIANVIIVFLFIGLICYFILVVRNTYEKQQVAERIAELTFQAAIIRNEYLQNPGERQKAQWISLYEARTRLLQENEYLFLKEPDFSLFKQLQSSIETSKELFQQLVTSVEKKESELVIQEINNQFSVRAQDRISLVLRLLHANREAGYRVAQVLFPSVMFVGAFVIIISIASYFTTNKVSRFIKNLSTGAKIISSGNLRYRVPILGYDEINDVAELFNKMTRTLSASQTILEKKVKDRTKEISAILGALDEFALVSTTDVKGNIVFVNDKFVEVSKYSRKELIGKNHRILKSGLQPQKVFEDLWKTISSGNVWRGEIMNRAKDGSYFWMDTCIAPLLNERGRPERYISVRFLITDRKIQEKTKSEFVSLASHQLRTPLTEVRWALASIARDASLDTEEKQKVDAARKAVATMSETIHAMLTIAHIDSGSLLLQKNVIRVKDILDSCLESLDGIQKRREVRTVLRCLPQLTLETDEQLFAEILMNILSNAYKYTPKGGTVTVSVTQQKTQIKIEVRDTGFGIPTQEQGRIFEKFFRATNIKDKEESGTGLGLYLVYSLIQSLGGTISFVSQENIGTTFTLTFPLISHE